MKPLATSECDYRGSSRGGKTRETFDHDEVGLCHGVWARSAGHNLGVGEDNSFSVGWEVQLSPDNFTVET